MLHVRKKGRGVAQRSLGFSLMRIKHRLPPKVGLTHIDAVLEYGELPNHYLVHSARADMYRRLGGGTADARSSYAALALTQQEPERQFLQERIRQLK